MHGVVQTCGRNVQGAGDRLWAIRVKNRGKIPEMIAFIVWTDTLVHLLEIRDSNQNCWCVFCLTIFDQA
jgi:hypothetical protein